MFKHASNIFLRLLLAVTILNLTGGHWLLLQTVAWSKMVVDYSKKSSLSQAVAQTFDGEHPCTMCKKIDQGREKEKKQELQQIQLKKDLLNEPRLIVLSPPRLFWFSTPPAPLLVIRGESPVPPPPRHLLG